MALSPTYQARELGEALGHIRGALSQSRDARQGYIARRAIKGITANEPGETAEVNDALVRAVQALNDAEGAIIELFRDL